MATGVDGEDTLRANREGFNRYQLRTRRFVDVSRLDFEPEFVEIYGRCSPYTMTTIERMYALYQATRYVVENRVPGDVVECGVWRGGSGSARPTWLISPGRPASRLPSGRSSSSRDRR